jgi:hypothetical protein
LLTVRAVAKALAVLRGLRGLALCQVEAPGKFCAQLLSENPDAFAEMIARLWPNTPKLEMFARKKRDGWDSWGNEV